VSLAYSAQSECASKRQPYTHDSYSLEKYGENLSFSSLEKFVKNFGLLVWKQKIIVQAEAFDIYFHSILLTPWRLGGFGDFWKKNSSFRLPYQRPSSSANCARELFNGSNGSASLVDCIRKKNFCLGVRVFL